MKFSIRCRFLLGKGVTTEASEDVTVLVIDSLLCDEKNTRVFSVVRVNINGIFYYSNWTVQISRIVCFSARHLHLLQGTVRYDAAAKNIIAAWANWKYTSYRYPWCHLQWRIFIALSPVAVCTRRVNSKMSANQVLTWRGARPTVASHSHFTVRTTLADVVNFKFHEIKIQQFNYLG